MMHPILKATLDHGQSIWLDYISRQLIDSGMLDKLVKEGLRGMTSNPTIFQKAVAGSADYDDDIRAGIECNWNPEETFEHLAVADIQRAADALLPVYNESKRTDGFVSLEVSPKLAYDTDKTIAEAKRLWEKVNRPNLMIKVPGTQEGLPAIRKLLGNGLNINVTLIFSLRQYKEVLETYLLALEDRIARKQDVSFIASVASFFVSRVDTAADKQLNQKGHSELEGKAAIANACVAYRHFLDVTKAARWKAVAAAGAQVQRPLWASTSTKNPQYSDVLYVHELVAEHTVNTLPQDTLEAWKDHGLPSAMLLENLKTADATLEKIHNAGIDLNQITEDLIEDGVKKFIDSYEQLLEAIRTKIQTGNLA